MSVQFEVACELDYLVQGASEFVFNIHAARGPQQRVSGESLRLEGASSYVECLQPGLGNRYVRVSVPEGRLSLRYAAIITVEHHEADPAGLEEVPVARLPGEVLPYVLPSRYCQSDRLMDFAMQEFGQLPAGFGRIQAVCDWVHRHVRFASGTTSVHSCALDVLVQRKGVCRDFAHLSIALLRALNIPARFATGYDYGVSPIYGPTDFHAYVEAYVGGRWYIFDATRLCPRKGLVRIGTGRDAADAAFATIFGPAQMTRMNLSIALTRGQMDDLADDYGCAISTSEPGGEGRWESLPRSPHLAVA